MKKNIIESSGLTIDDIQFKGTMDEFFMQAAKKIEEYNNRKEEGSSIEMCPIGFESDQE